MKQWIAAVAFMGAMVGLWMPATDGASSGLAQPASLSATLSPTYVQPGAQITATSTQPCPQPMQVFWSLGPGSLSGSVQTNTEGNWVVRITAPRTPGAYPFFAYCAFNQGGNAIAMYNQLNFTVVAQNRPPRFTG
jgi:hypothetical protein